MRFRLHILKCDDDREHSVWKRFRFAIIDLDRAKDYPINFVCMLPMQIDPRMKGSSAFVRFFEDKSLEVARQLLVDALELENDSEVKAEIKRRLKHLETTALGERVCVCCGGPFQVEPRKRSMQKFCSECLKKKAVSQK